MNCMNQIFWMILTRAQLVNWQCILDKIVTHYVSDYQTEFRLAKLIIHRNKNYASDLHGTFLLKQCLHKQHNASDIWCMLMYICSMIPAKSISLADRSQLNSCPTSQINTSGDRISKMVELADAQHVQHPLQTAWWTLLLGNRSHDGYVN